MSGGDNRRMSSSETAPMPLWRHPEFARGFKDMNRVSPGIAAWGLLTGVAMVKALPVPMAVFMSLVVFGGSAQLAALPLIASGAPMWVVWAAALCVNLRFVVLSALWRPYFSDQPRAHRLRLGYFAADLNFVQFMKRFPDPTVPDPARVPFFWGGVASNWTAWQVASLLGIALGDRVPASWGFGFAGTLALLGIGFSLIAGPSTWITAAVAGAAAVATYGLPLKLNLLVAIAAAVATGLVLDRVGLREGRAR